MFSFTFLLRALLSLSLILNGSGYAMAAAQMQLVHADMQHADMKVAASVVAAAPSAQHDGALPCDESMKMAHAIDMTPAHHASIVEDAPAVETGDHSGCCTSMTCDCVCLQLASAALAFVSVPPVPVLRTEVINTMAAGHATPALPHLMRPPIG